MCIPAPLTAYRAIRKLEPGHWLRWRKGEIETQRYWHPDFTKKLDIDEEEAGERTVEILRDAVKVRLMSEVPLGAFLSGGIDSSAVVALMGQESSERVKTFSIGFEEQDFSELHHARRIAEHVGADHHEFIVRPDAVEVLPMLVEHYGEPYADSSAVPTYYVAKETRKHVTVALNGDGGDESFAGYERYVAMGLTEKYRRVPSFLRESVIKETVNLIPTSPTKRSMARLREALAGRCFTPTVSIATCTGSASLTKTQRSRFIQTSSANRRCKPMPAGLLGTWFKRANGIGIVDAMLLTDQMTYLPNDLLVKVDIATMAVSLEARSPFLDHHVIEFAASLPEKLKLRRLTSKYLLKKVLRKLLPSENLNRRKMGFGVPIGHWFRGKMQPFLREVILSDKALRRGLFKPEAVRQLVELHTRGERDYSHQLWTLLMLELWFNRFID